MTVVYVESNFVLEIALGQEELEPAKQILSDAERGRYVLGFPSLAIIEPYSTVTNRSRERRRLAASLREQIRQLQRSHENQQILNALVDTPEALQSFERVEFERLGDVVSRMLRCGNQIDLSPEILDLSTRYRRSIGLAEADAIVLASIVSDLKSRPDSENKLLLNRNWREFDQPAVLSELASFGCRFAGSFATGLAILADLPEP